MKHRDHFITLAGFLVLLIAVLVYALSTIEDKQPIKEIFTVENGSEMHVYRVNTEPYEPSPLPNVDTPERYDKKYLEYLDRQQEARDRTFGGR